MKTALTNCTVLNGTENMQPQENVTVIIEDEKIVSIGHSIPGDCRLIDLRGRYLIPGLINMHVHLPGNGAPKETSKQNAKSVKMLMENPITRYIVFKMCAGYAKTELLSGVTTLRTVGGLLNIDSKIRDRINSGKMTGPRMLVSNMAISVPGGHMADVLAYPAHSEEECRTLVQKIAETKPDLIKLMITGGVLDATVKGEPGILKMPPEFVRACCDEAHKLGFHVAAHVESPEGVRVALENGVDTIEHGAAADEKIVELFKKHNAADICTVSPAIPLAHFGDSISNSTELTRFNGNVVLEGIISCAKAAREAGIPVGLGTDTACPFVTHYDMWRELHYFHKYVGVSKKEALHTATLKNAEILGIDNITGSIEVGKCADLVAVDKNPIEDLTTLRAPYMVATRGKIIIQPKVKKFENVERELDKEL